MAALTEVPVVVETVTAGEVVVVVELEADKDAMIHRCQLKRFCCSDAKTIQLVKC